MQYKKFFLAVYCITLTGLLTAQERVTGKDLEELRRRMTGFFTSEQQALSDSSYYNIHLHMAPVWQDRSDGYWMYVEQAMATAVQRPYRQRIYQLYQQDDTTLVSKVYELPGPLRFAGAWNNPVLLKSLNFDSLQARQGCAIFLHKMAGGNFTGSTPGKECLSSLRGATYATSEVLIEKYRMVSWDRGWNQDDVQVWGAVKGGYQFVKQDP
jgi:hypothetical protein